MSGRGGTNRRHPGGTGTRASGGGMRFWSVVGLGTAAVLAAGGWYLLQPSRASRIAAETIRLQEEVLLGAADPAASGPRIREIMRNIDRLPPDDIGRVRESLFQRLKAMRDESLDRFSEARPADRTALLDADLERIRVAQAILDATDQGGMRPSTEAELLERERRRRDREQESPKPQAAAPRSTPPPRPETDGQKRAAAYVEALTKRAKEKKIELGRLFGRMPGRG